MHVGHHHLGARSLARRIHSLELGAFFVKPHHLRLCKRALVDVGDACASPHARYTTHLQLVPQLWQRLLDVLDQLRVEHLLQLGRPHFAVTVVAKISMVDIDRLPDITQSKIPLPNCF